MRSGRRFAQIAAERGGGRTPDVLSYRKARSRHLPQPVIAKHCECECVRFIHIDHLPGTSLLLSLFLLGLHLRVCQGVFCDDAFSDRY